jgi:hypothetical protein
MNPDDPRVYQGGMFPVVTVEADRPNRLLFGRVRDAIKRWQEQNLYNQEYSGASDYIGAGLGMIGSEAARALANVASLGEYAVREIIPSGITGRPARRYSAYESDPASYAIAEAAMDFAPMPVIDDAIRAARRTATRRAARNVSDQIVRGSADVSAAREQAARVSDFQASGGTEDIFSMVGTMSDDERRGFLRDIMYESGTNWRQYYNENPQRRDQLINLYTEAGATEADARSIADLQMLKQQHPTPNLMVHDYPMSHSSHLFRKVYLPRLEQNLDEAVSLNRMTRSHANGILLNEFLKTSSGYGPGVSGAYNPATDYGWAYPSRDTITHEAAHALQGDIGREMIDRGVGFMRKTKDERDLRSRMNRAERIEQDAEDFRSGSALYGATAYEQVARTMIDDAQERFRGSFPWDTNKEENLIYNYIEGNKKEFRSRMGISDYMYENMLADAGRMNRASDYLKHPLEIQARVSGEFAERVLADKANNRFLKNIDPYNLPEYSELSKRQRDYMFENFFSNQGKNSILPVAYDKGESIDITEVPVNRQSLADEILSGFYDMTLPRDQGINSSIPSYLEYKDILPKKVLWEMFRNVTRSVPAVAAGTTAAGYGVSLGSDQ